MNETTATIASVRIVFRFKYIKFNPNLRWFSPDTSKALVTFCLAWTKTN